DGPPHGPLAFIEWDTFVRILDEFDGVTDLQLQGLGEPLMHPRFFDMVRYATDRGMKVSTNSNLTLLNRDRARQMVARGLEWLPLCKDYGESTLRDRYRPMQEFVSAQTLLGSDEAHTMEIFDQARAVAREVGIDLRLPNLHVREHPAGTPGRERCDWPWRGAY